MIRELKTSVGRLLSGPAPVSGIEDDLKKLCVDVIWNLGAELQYLIDKEKEITREVIHGDIFDGYPPRDRNKFLTQINIICDRLKDGRTVYVHCMGGQGRTGMVLACILNRLESLPPNQALMMTRQHCGGPSNSDQTEFVYDFCR